MIEKYRRAYRQALELARQAAGSSIDAAQKLPDILALLEAIWPAVDARSLLCQKIVTVSFSSGVIVSGSTITNSSQEKTQFPSMGCVKGVRGCVINASATGFGIEDRYVTVQIQINGDVSLTTNGKANTFAPLALLGGRPEVDGPWFPLNNRVTPADTWFAQCTSFVGAPDKASPGYIPFIEYLFEPDVDPYAKQ